MQIEKQELEGHTLVFQCLDFLVADGYIHSLITPQGKDALHQSFFYGTEYLEDCFGEILDREALKQDADLDYVIVRRRKGSRKIKASKKKHMLAASKLKKFETDLRAHNRFIQGFDIRFTPSNA